MIVFVIMSLLMADCSTFLTLQWECSIDKGAQSCQCEWANYYTFYNTD